MVTYSNKSTSSEPDYFKQASCWTMLPDSFLAAYDTKEILMFSPRLLTNLMIRSQFLLCWTVLYSQSYGVLLIISALTASQNDYVYLKVGHYK